MYSLEFIKSQIEYFGKYLLSGNAGDQSVIRAALLNYERELNKQGEQNDAATKEI